MFVVPLKAFHLLHFLKRNMKTWIVGPLSSYCHQVETPGLRKQQHHDQLVRMVVLLLVSSLCCPLHAQDNNDYISSNTNVTTIDTKVVISAPYAVFTKSLDVFTTGIPIHPVYIQAPSGLYVWLSIQCKGGAARLTVPDYVANYSLIQTDQTGRWIPSAGSQNATSGLWVVTGLGIMFNQNISVTNDALTTLAYGKGADNDIAGKVTMTITLIWNVTIPDRNDSFVLKRSRRIVIWAPTSLTSSSTFRATVAALCLVGIFVLCCLGGLNTVAVSSLRRFSVSLARETRDQQECEQNRVFNPLWMPCAPTQPEYYNIESTPNPLMLQQRRSELKSKILRLTTPFSLLDRLMRARHVKSSKYAWIRCRCPCAARPSLRDCSSSDDEKYTIRKAASKNQSDCCLSRPSSDDETQPIYPQQRGSQIGATSTQISTRASASWEQSQAATMNAQKFPASPGIYSGNQYYHRSQNAGLLGNRGSNQNTTVGFAFIEQNLAQDVNSEPNLRPESYGVFGAKNEMMNSTPAAKSLESASDSELEEEIVTESDLENGSLRYDGDVSGLLVQGEAPPLSFFSRGLRVGELPSAERGSDDSGRTSETCFRSPVSDIYEDVLES